MKGPSGDVIAPCDRRTFVCRSAAALAAAALPWGCASVALARVPVEAGAVRIRPADHPTLSGPGGYLRIQPADHASPVYLLETGRGEYAAVSPICTHLGCTVGIEGERLVCPCHGSTYDRAGRVLRGPAQEALRTFAVRREADGTIVISVGEG